MAPVSKIEIRRLTETEAEKYLRLRQRVEDEALYLLLEPGERKIDDEAEREKIRKALAAGNDNILVAEADHELIGFVSVRAGDFRRDRHAAHIVIGIRKAYSGQGLGTRLMGEVEKWAKENSLHRLDLEVFTDNAAALALYRKMGFEIEGTKRHAYFIKGSYFDGYYMAKLLP